MRGRKNPEIWELVDKGYTYSQAKYIIGRKKQGKEVYRDHIKGLTKEDLKDENIYVFEDGTVVWNFDCIEQPKTYKWGRYTYVKLQNKTIALHRLVYAWFHGYIPDDYVVDHIDNNPDNNNINNLQLLTRVDNMQKDRISPELARNQYTKDLTIEELLERKQKKIDLEIAKAEKEKEKAEYKCRMLKAQVNSKERASIIKELKENIDSAHNWYKITRHKNDKAAWKKAVNDYNDFIKNNPFITISKRIDQFDALSPEISQI